MENIQLPICSFMITLFVSKYDDSGVGAAVVPLVPPTSQSIPLRKILTPMTNSNDIVV